MLVVNAVAHEGRGGFGGEAAGLAQAERRSLHDELLELFDTRLDEHASLWENLVRVVGTSYLSVCLKRFFEDSHVVRKTESTGQQ